MTLRVYYKAGGYFFQSFASMNTLLPVAQDKIQF